METMRVEAMTLITHLIVRYVWVDLNRFVDVSNNHSKVIAGNSSREADTRGEGYSTERIRLANI